VVNCLWTLSLLQKVIISMYEEHMKTKTLGLVMGIFTIQT
jgi:hypothetical protein